VVVTATLATGETGGRVATTGALTDAGVGAQLHAHHSVAHAHRRTAIDAEPRPPGGSHATLPFITTLV
jgi:hypothetical protein